MRYIIQKTNKLILLIVLLVAANRLSAQITLTAADDTICAGYGTTLSLTVSGGLPPYTFNWGPSTGLSDPSVQNPVASPTVSTSYNVIVTDANSVSNSTTVNVTVLPPPAVDAGNNMGICLGTYASFSTPTTTGATYFWSFGDGNTDTTASTGHVYAMTGTYTVTVAVTLGCTATDSAVVNINPGVPAITPTASNTSCAGSCDGSITLTPTGGYSYTWFGASSTTNVATGLCQGTYSVSITNSFGCSAFTSAFVGSPAFMSLNTSPFQTICHGDTAMLYANVVSGGTPPFTYTWDNGSVIPGTDTMYFAPVSGTSYTVMATDSHGCTAGNSTGISVTASTDIYGHVTYSGGALSSGTNTAVLYKYLPFYTSFDSIQTTPVDASGDFHFAGANHNDYLVEIFPDNVANPRLIPTYYGDQFLWDASTVLNHGCGVDDTISIVMVETPVISGSGMITGTVVKGDGFSRVPGEPIPGIDVKLGRNPGGQMVTNTTTDGSGSYTFTNLPLNIPGEHYTIYVDIPGLVRDSTRDVTIDATDTLFVEQNYVADSNSVYFTDVTTGIAMHKAAANVMSVYPNPSNSNTTIEYSIADHATVSLGIYNVLGVKVAELVNTEQTAGNYKYVFNAKNYNLRSGIYFITLITEGKANIQRLVITE